MSNAVADNAIIITHAQAQGLISGFFADNVTASLITNEKYRGTLPLKPEAQTSGVLRKISINSKTVLLRAYELLDYTEIEISFLVGAESIKNLLPGNRTTFRVIDKPFDKTFYKVLKDYYKINSNRTINEFKDMVEAIASGGLPGYSAKSGRFGEYDAIAFYHPQKPNSNQPPIRQMLRHIKEGQYILNNGYGYNLKFNDISAEFQEWFDGYHWELKKFGGSL